MPRFDPVMVGIGVLLAGLAGMALAGSIVTTVRSRRRGTASLRAVDFVRASFTGRMVRGDPLDALLREVAESLRDFLGLDTAEIWVLDGHRLRLQVSDPPFDAVPLVVSPELKAVVLNAQVSGPAWTHAWLPELLERRPPGPGLRLAPIAHAGELLGLLIVARTRRADHLAEEADETLEELAREVGVGLYRAGLDAALRETLEQLRQRAADLELSRARVVAAGDAERRRIERNLHDGVQQYLVSVAVKARLAEQAAATEPERGRKLLGELLAEVECALEELRALSHGIFPPLLSSAGLQPALAAACRRLSPPARLDAARLHRYPPELEAAVYFCCVEALQNAAKHAGSAAPTQLRVWEEDGRLRFEARDSGRGFDPGAGEGAGLANMRDRLGAAGGFLAVESRVGKGTVVRGEVPVPAGIKPVGKEEVL